MEWRFELGGNGCQMWTLQHPTGVPCLSAPILLFKFISANLKPIVYTEPVTNHLIKIGHQENDFTEQLHGFASV